MTGIEPVYKAWEAYLYFNKSSVTIGPSVCYGINVENNTYPQSVEISLNSVDRELKAPKAPI